MSILKLTPHLHNIFKHSLRRLQVRNFQSSPEIPKFDLNDPVQLPEIEHNKYGKVLTVYKFSYMTHTQLFFNAKFYLPMVYIPLWIAQGTAYAMDELSFSDLMVVNIVQVILAAKFLLVNKWLTHLIGFMYLAEDDHLVIGYVNFRGGRIDEKFDKGELVLESNKVKILDKLYVTLRCSTTGRTFKLNLKWAKMNELILNDYFGPLPDSAF